jgi:Protein of unknown function (DUF4231)
MSPEATNAPEIDPIMDRLEDQIGWYDRKSMINQRHFKRIKMVEIAAAAIVPFMSAFSLPRVVWVTGGLGVLVAGVQFCRTKLQ